MQFPIVIGLRRSRILTSGLVIFTVLALLMVFVYPSLSLSFKLVFAGLIGYFSFATWQKLTPAVECLRLERDGKIAIRIYGQSDFLPVSIVPGVTVHPWLTVFRLKTDTGQMFTLIATVDTLKRQNFRRLRVFLRWCADFSNAAADDAV